ncbi:MAG: alpha-galactosidase [Candidatus Izemoplasmatales bacterium]|nr:alpha-galactosidase [Candidatus Izemoplasmatales bacterium]MDD4987358.1 alpha-galactosidase [Candidatus Izemoplasmatales bacterium]MDY0373013.1 alpha-galactosidase [Candidatus Izemoplasmatales bacterium]
MIRYNESKHLFHLQTVNTSYMIRLYPSRHVGHLYYGKRIPEPEDINSLDLHFPIEVGGQVIYDNSDKTFNLNLALLEVSTYGKGDFRDPMMHFRFADGSRLSDFTYESHQIFKQKPEYKELPSTQPRANIAADTLEIIVSDSIRKMKIRLLYTVYDQIDVITRRAIILNESEEEVLLEKALSMNLDLLNEDYELLSLDGAWIRERQLTAHPLQFGILKIDSKKGVSSSDHNPSVFLKQKLTDETQGKCYGFSLVYSGNFEASAEVSPHGLLRMMMGINSFDFYWPLAAKQQFVTPEVVLSFSHEGLARLSQNFHELVNHYVIPEKWQDRERPVLINNWEATFFDFTERKLLKIAKQAKKMGIELFVLDDGWFGKRDNDTSSLGDWTPHSKKLPGGLGALQRKIKRIGLDFGIWVEPEMVNPDSDLYRAHPDWVIQHPQYPPSLGRNQLILDLANPKVENYLFEQLSNIFDSAQIVYCKWDMNRNFSDIYSNYLPAKEQGSLTHRYVLGLYSLLNRLKNAYPDMLFEACASGGNRTDLGLLHYMPQVWMSDNTDGVFRQRIQAGTSYVYPLSTMGAHVSDVPNQQTLRNTPLETRFNTACFGLLGYELDLTELTRADRRTIQQQIAYYKAHRRLFQFGQFERLQLPFTDRGCGFMSMSHDQEEAMLGWFQTLSYPNGPLEKLPVRGLDPQKTYQVNNRPQFFNLSLFGRLVRHALPIRLNANGLIFHWLKNRYLMPIEVESQTVSGEQLLAAGFCPKQQFIGSGYHDQIRLMGDFGSRIYYFKAQKER